VLFASSSEKCFSAFLMNHISDMPQIILWTVRDCRTSFHEGQKEKWCPAVAVGVPVHLFVIHTGIYSVCVNVVLKIHARPSPYFDVGISKITVHWFCVSTRMHTRHEWRSICVLNTLCLLSTETFNVVVVSNIECVVQLPHCYTDNCHLYQSINQSINQSTNLSI
jgi:hypothetical protein